MKDVPPGGARDPDRYRKRSTSYSPEAVRTVDHWIAMTGKSWSETVCLLILAGAGNMRLYRHALASPLNTLRFTEQLCRNQMVRPDQQELLATFRSQLEDIERILTPPRPQ